MPIFLTNFLPAIGLPVDTATQRHIELMLFGGLMIFFLIVEPHGLCPAVADRQGKAASVAVPPLTSCA